MKIKQMADEARKRMPEGLNELETLRYIYIFLGKQKSFDPEYYFGNKEVKKKIYELHNRRLENEDFLVSNRNLICTSISHTLKLLGKEFGIDIEVKQNRNTKCTHMYNVGNLKDGRKIHLDLQMDLKFIHMGRRTGNFGTLSDLCTMIAVEDIEAIDEKIGYKNPDKDYTEKILIDILQRLKDKKGLEKVKGLLSDKEFKEILEEKGYVESQLFVSDALVTIGALESNVITCYRDKNIYNEPLPETQYSMCVFAQGEREEKGKFDIYIYKKRAGRFVNVSVEEMRMLVEQGLKLKPQGNNLYEVNLLREILENSNLWGKVL